MSRFGRASRVYGTLGVGVAIVSADGWQTSDTRRSASRTQSNLAYSAGVDVSYAISKRFSTDVRHGRFRFASPVRPFARR
ncbi:outer membrane protein [Burkholderia metallica]|uniref:outer membrane protein n=1 Tax=Burkholderia metallica TaxID=488729 RepID=UPI001CF5BA8A|nr:hypothetical protein [Burkholderia metallica]MCA8003192.1 hypothetical protein [Burkholderia metallica]